MAERRPRVLDGGGRLMEDLSTILCYYFWALIIGPLIKGSWLIGGRLMEVQLWLDWFMVQPVTLPVCLPINQPMQIMTFKSYVRISKKEIMTVTIDRINGPWYYDRWHLTKFCFE